MLSVPRVEDDSEEVDFASTLRLRDVAATMHDVTKVTQRHFFGLIVEEREQDREKEREGKGSSKGTI